MLEAATGKQRFAFDQRLDDAVVGIALLAVVIHDASTLETGGVGGVGAAIIDRERDARIDAAGFEFLDAGHPGLKVLAAVGRSGVDETGTGIVGDMVAGEEWNGEVVAEILEGMGAGDASQFVGGDAPHTVEGELCLSCGFVRQAVCKDQFLARLRAKIINSFGDFVEAIGDLRRIGDGAVARDRPRRRRPDDHMGVSQFCRATVHRELHPDRVALVVVVFDLGFRQRRALDNRPHDGLRAAIELAAHGDLQELAGDAAFRVEIHGQVGFVEIADDAEALEFFGLDRDPLLRIGAAFLAEFDHRVRLFQVGLGLALGAVILFLDLPLDRQTVAIPAGNVVRIIAAHLERAGDDVLEDLVQRMADMDVAVGIGRTIVQHELFATGGRGTQLLVEIHLAPARNGFRLFLRQACTHRKLGLGQIEGLRVIELFSHCISHIGYRLWRRDRGACE